MGFLGKLIRGNWFFQRGMGFTLGKRGFGLGKWLLEGSLLGKCVKPKGKGENEGEKGVFTRNNVIMGKLAGM